MDKAGKRSALLVLNECVSQQSPPWTLFILTHIHACIQKPHLTLRVSSIPQSSVHLSVLQHLFTNSNLWNGNQCLRFQLCFSLLTKDLQKKSQCQIQRLPKLSIHQIILAMRGFLGHEHRTNSPRPEIGQEKCFMCRNQTSTMFCCIVICCCQCSNKTS